MYTLLAAASEEKVLDPLLKAEDVIEYESYPDVVDSSISLNVINLSYAVGRRTVHDTVDCFKKLTPSLLQAGLPKVRSFDAAADLSRVNFTARFGKITAIMGPDEAERRTLTDLIGQRRRYGEYSGDIIVNEAEVDIAYEEAVCFVPRKTLYIPGLTYYDLVLYSARLRIPDIKYLHNVYTERTTMENDYLLEKRVNEVLDIMGLTKMKYRVIEERPVLRGELGGDLRRLSIAMEIVALPPVIVLEDPLYGMDPGVSVKVFACLKKLSRRGHVVVCSLVKPLPQIFEAVDSLVLLSNGRSIYSGEIKYLESFFCSAAIGYKRKKATDMVDFLMDIALGTERPQTQREAHSPQTMQDLMEKSAIFDAPRFGREYVCANDAKTLKWYGYAHSFSCSDIVRHTRTILSRALYVKFHEVEIIKKSIGASALLALYVGSLDLNDGDFGYYCLTLFGIPYGKPSNITGALFFSCSVMWIQQVLNVHILCQKLQVFRYEQSHKAAPILAMAIATALSEIPFSAFYALVYANICYFMVVINYGYDNYMFFMGVLLLTSVVAFITAALFASIFRREIIVRDMFLLCVFSMLMLSGFPFQFSGLNNSFEQISQINPMRWAFEGLMVWKFYPYADGPDFLRPYDFQNFDKWHVYTMLPRFIAVSGVLLLLSMLPPLNFLSRRDELKRNRKRGNSKYSRASSMDSESNDAFDSDVPIPTRVTMAIKPIIFARESSITSKSQLSISVSQTGEHNTEHGPTVTLEDVGYRIKDITSPLGERTLLQNVYGQFDWGKLSMIMGSSGAGKSTLLHVIAGDSGKCSSGEVLFNRDPVAADVLPWQRCAYVEATDEHFRDLTVLQTVTYAMKLRCLNRNGLSVVEENVERTLELLSLSDVKDVKVKKLSKGDVRRLSIAEEIVHGPQLLLIDEPTTGLDIRDISTMLMMFREMVNQDKTVIATMHQPSAAAFKVFDTLMLLSRGRVIYHGTVENAQSFFVTSPYAFKEEGYENPADYLLDISAGILKDCNKHSITSIELAKYYEESELFTYRKEQMNSVVATDGYATSMAPSWNQESVDSFLDDEGDAETALSASAPTVGAVERKAASEHALLHGLANHESISMDPIEAKRREELLHRNSAIRLADVVDFLDSVRKMDVETYMWKLYILTERSTVSLLQRKKLLVGSMILYVCLAAALGLMLGNTSRIVGHKIIEIAGQKLVANISTYFYNTTAFFAISMLLLLFANVQLIYYWLKVNEVFYKEHSRGLLSNIQQWLSASPALYLMRIANTSVFGLIVYDMLVLRNKSEIIWFYFLTLNVAVIAGTMLCEAVATAVPDIRAAYQVIPGVLFFNFAFSGIFVKTPTLAPWAHWLPTISLFRWVVQAQAINLFDNDTTLPVIEIFSFSAYDKFLGLFGWGNISKWKCFWIIVWNLIVYRGLILIFVVIKATVQKGKRQFRKSIEDQYKMY